MSFAAANAIPNPGVVKPQCVEQNCTADKCTSQENYEKCKNCIKLVSEDRKDLMELVKAEVAACKEQVAISR